MARQYQNPGGNRNPAASHVEESTGYGTQFWRNLTGGGYQPMVDRAPVPSLSRGPATGEAGGREGTPGYYAGQRAFTQRYPGGVQDRPMPTYTPPVAPTPAQSYAMTPAQPQRVTSQVSFDRPSVPRNDGFMGTPSPRMAANFPVNPTMTTMPAQPAPMPVLPGANPNVGYVPNASRTALQFEAAQRQAIERNPTPQQAAEGFRSRVEGSVAPVDTYTGFDVLTGKGDVSGRPPLQVSGWNMGGLSQGQQDILRSQGRVTWGDTAPPPLPRAPAVPLDRQPGAEQALADLRAANAPGSPNIADSEQERTRIAQAQTRREAYNKFLASSEGQRLQQNRDNARMQRMSPQARANEVRTRDQNAAMQAGRERAAAEERASAPQRDLMASQAEKNRAEAAAAGGKAKDQDRNAILAAVDKFARTMDPNTGEFPPQWKVNEYQADLEKRYSGGMPNDPMAPADISGRVRGAGREAPAQGQGNVAPPIPSRDQLVIGQDYTMGDGSVGTWNGRGFTRK